MSLKFLNFLPLSFGVQVLEDALEFPHGVLGEALSFLLKGVPCYPCVGVAIWGCISAISSSSSSCYKEFLTFIVFPMLPFQALSSMN